MAEPDLLPCPLFSENMPHEVRMDETVSGRALRYVITCSCGLTFNGAYADAGSEVAPGNAKKWTIATWNHRAPSPAPDQTNAEVSDERLREALPCPFCGVVPEIVKDRYGYQVECHNVDCGAMPTAAAASKSEAVDAWNRRSVTSQASEGAEEMEVEITGIGRDGHTGKIKMLTIADDRYKTSERFVPASPSKRVERLEAAPIDTFRESRCEYCGDLNWQAGEGCRVSSGHSWLLTDRTLAVYLALQGDRS